MSTVARPHGGELAQTDQARAEFAALYRELYGTDKRSPAAVAISANVRATFARWAEILPADVVEEARAGALAGMREAIAVATEFLARCERLRNAQAAAS